MAFELREIDKVDPTDGEDTDLAAERHLLANADRIHRLATESCAELYDGDNAILGRLDTVWKQLDELTELVPSLAAHRDTRDAVSSQLEEVVFALRPSASGIEASPERLQNVEDRLAQLERLKRSFGPTLGDVIARRRSLQEETTGLDGQVAAEETLVECVAAAAICPVLPVPHATRHKASGRHLHVEAPHAGHGHHSLLNHHMMHP